MIPTYLKSLAATVRDLVASGKAVHVTNETAAELDLLAGLPWNQAPLICPLARDEGIQITSMQPITPADLALGWLLASRALSQGQIWHDNEITCQEVLTSDRQRAAECAELAVIAAWYPVMPPGVERVRAEEDLSALYIGIPMLTVPYAGTREGARAAWGFVVEQLTRSADSVEENTRKPDANIDRFVGRRLLGADRYRRELEAM